MKKECSVHACTCYMRAQNTIVLSRFNHGQMLRHIVHKQSHIFYFAHLLKITHQSELEYIHVVNSLGSYVIATQLPIYMYLLDLRVQFGSVPVQFPFTHKRIPCP